MKPSPIRSFTCSAYGQPSVVAARSAGAARYRHFLDIHDVCPDLRLIDIRVRVLPGVVQSEDFDRVARRRGVPFAKVGMRVLVDGKAGHIVGHNSSANFDVLFEESGHTLNCHPRWKVRYFAEGGEELIPDGDGRGRA